MFRYLQYIKIGVWRKVDFGLENQLNDLSGAT